MRILLTQEAAELWAATCLDYYCVGQGASPEKAVANLGRTMRVEFEMARERNEDWRTHFKPAPASCWNEYWGSLKREREPQVPVRRFAENFAAPQVFLQPKFEFASTA